MAHSKITHGNGGTTFVGPDAIRIFQAAALRSGLGLLAVGIKPYRGWTIRKALAAATHYTGRIYRRTEIEQARRDLQVWIDEAKRQIPTERTT